MLDELLSKDVYKLLRAGLGPTCKENGWKRTKGAAGWQKPLDSGYIAFSFQNTYRWDPFSGGELRLTFVMSETEMQRPHMLRDGMLHCDFLELLDPSDVSLIHAMQNDVISRRQEPTDAEPFWISMQQYYRERREPLAIDDFRMGNLAYCEASDAERWAEFVRVRLQLLESRMEERFLARHPNAERRTVEAADYTPWEAIVADPDNDEPRLVYADWLDERGDPRGEFIRIQCQVAAGELNDDSVESRTTRRHMFKLLEQNRGEWLAEFDKLPITQPVFTRGFVSEVVITQGQFIKKGKATLEKLPLLELLWIKGATSGFGSLAEAEHASLVRSVGFMQTRILDTIMSEWIAWLESPHWSNVRHLMLDRCSAIRDGALVELVQSSMFRRLKKLNVSQQTFEPALQPLEAFDGEAQLESLILAGCKLRVVDMQRLANSAITRKIRRLDLSNNTIGNRGAKALLGSALPELEELRLGYNRFTDKVVDILLAAHAPKLKRLFIGDVSEAGRKALSERYELLGAYTRTW